VLLYFFIFGASIIYIYLETRLIGDNMATDKKSSSGNVMQIHLRLPTLLFLHVHLVTKLYILKRKRKYNFINDFRVRCTTWQFVLPFVSINLMARVRFMCTMRVHFRSTD